MSGSQSATLPPRVRATQPTRLRPRLRTLVRRPVVWLIRAYQLVLSPLRPPSCRFYPSCSSYAITAIERFGLVRGGWLAVRRLLRCHPWNPGGVDHVPQTAPASRGHPPAHVHRT